MASAFKNFFITFAICLLVFGFLGFKYGLDFLNSFKVSDDTEQSVTEEEPQDDVSTDTSIPDVSLPETPSNIVNPDGDVFTAVVMIVDENNRPINMAFIDSNAKTERFVYCTIPVTTRITNEIGTSGTVQDLFATFSKEKILQCVSAMTGIDTQYCMIFNRNSLASVAREIPGASVKLDSPVTYIPEGSETVIFIDNLDGRVLLSEDLNNKPKIEWLLGYAPEGYTLNEYNSLYSSISKSLIRQFFQSESYTNNDKSLSAVIRACDTNLSIDEARNHADAIFAYNDFEKTELTYSGGRESAIKTIRNADGSYQ